MVVKKRKSNVVEVGSSGYIHLFRVNLCLIEIVIINREKLPCDCLEGFRFIWTFSKHTSFEEKDGLILVNLFYDQNISQHIYE